MSQKTLGIRITELPHSKTVSTKFRAQLQRAYSSDEQIKSSPFHRNAKRDEMYYGTFSTSISKRYPCPFEL